MKISKCLIFKVNQQKYAIKTKYVINVIENVKLIHNSVNEVIDNVIFNFNGFTIPFVNFQKSEYITNVAECVLIAEANVNNIRKVIGIAIDEIIEVSEIDDLMSYKFIPVNEKKTNDYREAIVIHNNEPVTILNIDKLWSNRHNKKEFSRIEVSIN